MARDLYREGFAAGWLAASKKLIEAMPPQQRAPALSLLAMAGAAPARRRGRPPKAVAAAQPVKRRRGRPRKADKAT
jgi:AT hook motif